jgi:hypothetical protein
MERQGDSVMISWYDYMIKASRESRYNAGHWFRYLRKVIFEHDTYLTQEDVERLLASQELTDFQKVSLKYAVQEGTPTHEHIVSLNKPAQLSNVQALLEKYKYG